MSRCPSREAIVHNNRHALNEIVVCVNETNAMKGGSHCFLLERSRTGDRE
jgi:hypothetical protein